MTVPRSLARWIPALLYGLAIFVVSSLPASVLPSAHVSDKLVHFAEFAGFGLVLAWAIGRFWPAFLAGALYGVLDEVHQYFTPGRRSDPLDAVADMAGAAAGAALLLAAAHLLRQRGRLHGDRP